MTGTPESGFSEISSLSDREKHYSDAAYLDDELVLIADSELFRFDGHLAKTFTPKVKLQLGSKRVQPSAIFAREDRLDLPLKFHPAAIRASAVFEPPQVSGPSEARVFRLHSGRRAG
ncbi:hypothetical protein G6M70_17005 [Agrobacterium tumefaciens]|uniref:hypothetical protein n=1 Tax=Agrobacterium tumefaciens TaxID=358 RepID=UPI0015721C19|nr:hypothetical protein [Agrobacterium tumefaciens]NSZ01992.1 hypothetical protein [Agrobacterium tumefaciens]NSZ38647.1 hypothetical protein [Agrobacterium tumefaciens]NTB05841.1 hypothetical protein [Agrobacterium tumefaciens]NTB21935.1 hypothetical protein [Agrobacterium tumefaciens]NTB28454.1 hypothetical protein [Agrobacterium tumefaciens]